MANGNRYRHPRVSVIIPVKNSEKTIELCLKSVKNQSYNNIEVIVVDGGSSDNTVAVSRKYTDKVFVVKGERSKQKNYGAFKASGSFVYFVDSDFWLHPKTIEEAVDLVERGYDAVIIPNISYPKRSIWAKARFYERLSYMGSGVYEAARFIRKSLFISVKGFEEDIYANEDYFLHTKLVKSGARIGRLERAFEVHIGEPRSLREITVKYLYYGGSLKDYFSRNPNILHMLPIRPTFFKRDFVAWFARRWLKGYLILILLKIVQASSSIISGLFGIKPRIYERVSSKY